MTLSVLFFYSGFYFRERNNRLHRILNLSGTTACLLAAIYLLLLKYFLGGIENAGIYPAVERWIIDVHRFFAAISLFLMLFMAYSGIKRKKEIHKKIAAIFLPLYTVIYFSGILLFKNTI